MLTLTLTIVIMNKTISTKTLLFIGLLASIFVGIGEFLIHFLPEGPDGEISMLYKVPLDRASKGHFFAIYAAPFYFAGYYGLMRFFKSSNQFLATLLFILGVLSFSYGGVYISSRYFAAEVFQRSMNTPDFEFYLASYEKHYQSTVWALRICILSVSAVYTLLVLKNKVGMPKWLAIFNPIVLLILIISSLVWFKPLGVYIAPIAMNVTHFIFFGIILFQLNKQKQLT